MKEFEMCKKLNHELDTIAESIIKELSNMYYSKKYKISFNNALKKCIDKKYTPYYSKFENLVIKKYN